jgi:anti-sigma regulatory factor (Ser/Thr protein kinase)
VNAIQMRNANEIRARGQDLELLFQQLGDSPEMAQARLRLEEALMWAVKHATRGA